MKVFVDSCFIIALVLKRDSLHKRAVDLTERGILDNECYISDLIFNEVITIVGNKENNEIAKTTYYYMKDNFKIINEFDIPNFKDKTMETYLKYNTKLSFTDSAILEIIKEYNLDKLVSFDEYYKKTDVDLII